MPMSYAPYASNQRNRLWRAFKYRFYISHYKKISSL